MSDQEKIVCAAFKFVFSCCEEIVLSVDYEMNDYAKNLYCKDGITDFFKGFITNKKRFVCAQEAKRIAIDAKQVPYHLDHYMGGYVEPLKLEELY